MVGRHEEVVPVVVVDLDGTLLRGNSFKLYVRCGACALLRKRRLGGFVRLLAATFLRKLSVITHNRYREMMGLYFKYCWLKGWVTVTNFLVDFSAQTLVIHVHLRAV